jgi:hypothetical protein
LKKIEKRTRPIYSNKNGKEIKRTMGLMSKFIKMKKNAIFHGYRVSTRRRICGGSFKFIRFLFKLS